MKKHFIPSCETEL